MRIASLYWLLPAAVLVVGSGREVWPAPSRAGYPPARMVSVVDNYHLTLVAFPLPSPMTFKRTAQ